MYTVTAPAHSAMSAGSSLSAFGVDSNVTPWASRKSIATKDLIAKFTFWGRFFVLPANLRAAFIEAIGLPNHIRAKPSVPRIEKGD